MGNFIFNEYVNVFKNGGEYIADNDTNLGVALIKSCPFNCTYKSLDTIKEYVAIDYNITIPEIYGIKSLDGVELAYNEIGVDANILIKAFSAIFEGETWFSACGCVIFRNKDDSTVVDGEYPEGETELIAYYDFGEQVVTEGTPFKIIWKGASEIDPESKGTVIVYTPELTDIYESMTNQGQVKTTSADEHLGYLFDKLAEGEGIGLTVENEKVVITNTKEDFIKSISSTDSVILSATSGDLSGYVRISESSGNILSVSADGLYVPETIIPEDYITSATDSHSVLLFVDDKILSAIVNISETSGNILDIKEDGLYVPETEVPVKSILEGDGIQIDDDGNGNFTVNATTEVQSISSVSGINAVPDTSGTWNIGILLSEDEGNKAKFSENDNGLYVGTDMPDFTSADEGKILTPNSSGDLEWRLLTGIHAPNAEIEATSGTTLTLNGTRTTSAFAGQDMYATAGRNIYVNGGSQVSTTASFQIDRTAPYIKDTVANYYALITGQDTGLKYSGGVLGIYGSILAINETNSITENTSGSIALKAGNKIENTSVFFTADACASSSQGTKYYADPGHAQILSKSPSSSAEFNVGTAEISFNVRNTSGIDSGITVQNNKIILDSSSGIEFDVGESGYGTVATITSGSFSVNGTHVDSSPCSMSVGSNMIMGNAENISFIASSIPNRPVANMTFLSPMGNVSIIAQTSRISLTSAGNSLDGPNTIISATSSIGMSVGDTGFTITSGGYDFSAMNETTSSDLILAPDACRIQTRNSSGAINSYSTHHWGTEQAVSATPQNYFVSDTTSAYQTNILNGDISTYPYIQNAVYTTSSDGSITTTKYSYQVIHNGGISLYSNAQGSISLQWNGTNESGSVQMGSLGTQNVQIFGRNGVKISALNDTCRVYLGWSDTIVHGTNAFLETNNDQIGVTNSGVNVNAKNPIYIHTETSAPVEVRSGATTGSYSQLYMQGTNFTAQSYGDASNFGMLTLSPSHVYLGVDPVVGNHSGMDIGVTSVSLSAYATSAYYSTMMMTPGNIMTVMMNGQISQKSLADNAQGGWETTPSRFKIFTSADNLVSEMTMTPTSYSVGLTSGSATIRAEELNLVASSTNGNTPFVNVVASSGDITFVSSNMMINASTRLTSATTDSIVDVEDQDHGSDNLNGILATSYAGGQMFRFGVKKDTIRTSATADNETIPTEKAVRAAIDSASSGGTEWYCGSFTTANRPSNPTEGQYGYDTTIDCVIYYIGGEWKNSAGATV